MKGDFSRVTFDPTKNFIQVLKQQGRVELDADWNEQSDILLHYIQTLARDLIGPHGGPYDPEERGFGISLSDDGKDLKISPGRYYVDGLLVENHGEKRYRQQLNAPENDLPKSFLAFLEVWKRHVTCYEDPSLLEPALGGIDTTTRTQLAWAVRIFDLADKPEIKKCSDIKKEYYPKRNARLRAGTVRPTGDADPCNIEADARYRGAENQLYRVEVHSGNVDEFGNIDDDNVPTFKWSRENGSVIFPVVKIRISSDGGGETTTVELANLGRDDKSGLREGNVVEIVDEAGTLRNFIETPTNGKRGTLQKVLKVDHDRMEVTLEGRTDVMAGKNNFPLLRRWDQKAKDDYSNGIPITESSISGEGDKVAWTHDLEDGIKIQFVAADDADVNPTLYRTGDYWLIPARTVTRDVLWPLDDKGKAVPQPAGGIEHHYAPLAMFINGTMEDCRCAIATPCGKDERMAEVAPAPNNPKPNEKRNEKDTKTPK